MPTATHDFGGMASAYEVPCTDGRTIGTGSFDHQNGDRVPLVYRHKHDEIDNVLGHGILNATPQGMRIERAVFNQSKNGKTARILVQAGDLDSLSVWANGIVESGGRVTHGDIREVSLVIAGKNPGAKIDDVIQHGSGGEDNYFVEGEVIIRSGAVIELFHEVEEEEETDDTIEHSEDETLGSVLKTFSEPQIELFSTLLYSALGGKVDAASGGTAGKSDMKDVYASLNEKQKEVMHLLIGDALADNEKGVTHDMTTETHSIFEPGEAETRTLSHDEMNGVLTAAVAAKSTTLKQDFLAHAADYGVENLEILFPDATVVDSSKAPAFYDDDQSWVLKVTDKARKVPFSRIKSRYADITVETARARGYITTAEKFDNVFRVFSRVTTPQTVYVRSKLDRDDIIDVTDFSIVAWMKQAQRVKLKEEIARAILVTDGREITHADKINVENIRPIYGDDIIYSHVVELPLENSVLEDSDAITRSHKHYKGSGMPTLFTSTEFVTDMLLVRDSTGRPIYKTVKELAGRLRVKEIVEIPVLSGMLNPNDPNLELLGIIVNMRDYTIGADKGGTTTFFEDFDIDFNTYKYLYETRMSGALTIPKSAIILERNLTAA